MRADGELRIDGIAAGGAGVGRDAGGRVVFVHRTVPGERVTYRIREARQRWARGTLVRVLDPAPDRREAPCRFYDRCGGCTLEHLAYPAQLAAKSSIVADALARIGGLAVAPPPVVPSPQEFRYRNRVSFTLVRLRDGRVLAGFHELNHPDRVLDIDETCMMPESAVAGTWGAIRRHWGGRASRLPSGPRLRLTVRGTAHGRAALLVQGGYGPGRAEELIARVPQLAAIWHAPLPERAPVLLAGDAQLMESWQDEELNVGGAVFLQVNREAAELLEEHVLEVAGDVAQRTVVDAYCGVGLHARRLARQGARIVGIELDELAVAEAQRALPGAHFVMARVEDALGAHLPTDLVILNPPRAGVAAEVVAALGAQPAARIIYVSCDPATLARDLRRLAPVYSVRSIRCFDLFPQTAHVETVVELTCSTT